MKQLLLPLLISLGFALVSIHSLPVSGTATSAFYEQPGVTLDESFNVGQGVYLVRSLQSYGIFCLHPASLQEVFNHSAYLPDHPPLGRLILGLAHELRVEANHQEISIIQARAGSLFLFALTIFIVGVTARRWDGRTGGLIAMFAFIAMPRLFGHAHLAALETAMNLFYLLTILAVGRAVSDEESSGSLPTFKQLLPASLCWSFALLTKMQAVLLPIPIAIWMLLRWRWKCWKPFLYWSVTGFLLFFLFWPWLWSDPWNHLMIYLGRATDRTTLYSWYLGERFTDKAVPWHYPWVMFALTVPAGLHVLGLWGVFQKSNTAEKRSRQQLLLCTLLFPLVLFSLPNIPVYDGARLFLIVFPLWTFFIAQGGIACYHWLNRRLSPSKAGLLFIVFLCFQSIGLWQMNPCHLSYYNVFAGGLKGADKLGFERCYWGDALTPSLRDVIHEQVPRRSLIDVSPVMHPFWLRDLSQSSPLFMGEDVQLRPWSRNRSNPPFLLVFFRKADEPPEVANMIHQAKPIAIIERQSVPLAGLYAFPQSHQ